MMTLRWAAVLGIVLAFAAGVGAAVDPALDFTGHWTGFTSEDDGPPQTLAADLVTQSGHGSSRERYSSRATPR